MKKLSVTLLIRNLFFSIHYIQVCLYRDTKSMLKLEIQHRTRFINHISYLDAVVFARSETKAPTATKQISKMRVFIFQLTDINSLNLYTSKSTKTCIMFGMLR